jgi:hypothetical protein
MRAHRALPIVVAAALAAALSSPARAASADDAEADAAIKRGVELRRHAKDQEALEEFRKAHALVKSARALAQIGLAEQALGRWVDAENDLAEAMASKTDPWIRKNQSTLNGAVDVIRKHLGSLDVIGPAGAELLLDGRVAGTLPLAKPARVPIGSLTIEVKKDGFFPSTRPVSITAGELTRESVDLQPQPVAPAVRTPPPPVTPAEGGGTAGPLPGIPGHTEPVSTHPDDQPEHSGGVQRTLAWVTAGVALAGVGAGVAELLIRNSKLNEADGVPCNIMMSNGMVAPPNGADGPRCTSLANAADQAKVGAIIAFSAAGALAITSAILFATSSSSSSSAHAGSMLVCAPSLFTASATCQLRF